MKPTLVLLCCLLMAISCRKNKNNDTNNPATLANDSVYNYHSNFTTMPFSTITDNYGNIVMLATTRETKPVNPAYKYASVIFKYAQSGNFISQHTINIPDTAYYGQPRLYSIAQTTEGDFLLCGTSYKKVPYNGSFVIGSDIALMKTNSNGDVLWLKTLGGDKDDYGTLVMKTRDGNYLVAGNSMSFGKDYYNDVYLVKVNTNGDILWSKNYDAPEQQHIGGITETADGHIFLNITDNYGTGHANLMWMMIDANGNIIWQKQTVYGSNAHAGAAELCNNGDIMLMYLNDLTHIVRLDKNANIVWDNSSYTTPYNVNPLMGATCLKHNGDNTYTLAGNNSSINGSASKLHLYKIQGDGNLMMYKQLPGEYINVPYNLLKATNGNNIITGIQVRDSTLANIFLIKTNDY